MKTLFEKRVFKLSQKLFRQMGEVKNEAFLSHLAQTRGAIVYIG